MMAFRLIRSLVFKKIPLTLAGAVSRDGEFIGEAGEEARQIWRQQLRNGLLSFGGKILRGSKRQIFSRFKECEQKPFCIAKMSATLVSSLHKYCERAASSLRPRNIARSKRHRPKARGSGKDFAGVHAAARPPKGCGEFPTEQNNKQLSIFVKPNIFKQRNRHNRLKRIST